MVRIRGIIPKWPYIIQVSEIFQYLPRSISESVVSNTSPCVVSSHRGGGAKQLPMRPRLDLLLGAPESAARDAGGRLLAVQGEAWSLGGFHGYPVVRRELKS